MTNAPLENLPAEIRRELLFSMEVDELRGLVHASPVFHEQYRLDRRAILLNCLEESLGSAMVEACAVAQAMAITAGIEDAREKDHALARFDETYRARRLPARCYHAITEKIKEDEAILMVKMYVSTIKPIAERYAVLALANLREQTGDEDQPAPLSKTEKRRIMRALYRFQFSCCCFSGVRREDLVKGKSWSYAVTGTASEWMITIEPWEIEEFVCIYDFIKYKYAKALRDVEWDVHPDNPKFNAQGWSPMPPGAFLLDLDANIGKSARWTSPKRRISTNAARLRNRIIGDPHSTGNAMSYPFNQPTDIN